MTEFLHKQLVVMAGAALGVAVVVIVWANLPAWFNGTQPATDDTAGRLAFALRWLLAPGVALAVGVLAAGRRGFYADAIDGTRTPSDRGLEINLRYNQNTLEQTVLASIAWISLALVLPHRWLAVIPAMASLFLSGRAVFWVGYRIWPPLRAFGMVLTALPTFAAYVWLVWRLAPK
jgi:hypothetical protein